MNRSHQYAWTAIALAMIGFAWLITFDDNPIAKPKRVNRSEGLKRKLSLSLSTRTTPEQPNRRIFQIQKRLSIGQQQPTDRLSGFVLANSEESDFDLPELELLNEVETETTPESTAKSLINDRQDVSEGEVVFQPPSTPALDRIPDDMPLVESPSPNRELDPKGNRVGPGQSILEPLLPNRIENPAFRNPAPVMVPGKTVPAAQQPIASAIIETFLQKVRYGNSLARRGAIASAYEELESSISLLAEALDQHNGTQQHVNDVYKAFKALDEVSDFAEWNPKLSLLVAGHETPVLQSTDLDKLTFHQARLAYLGYAEKLLYQSCASTIRSADAFCSLGKVFRMQETFAKDSTMSQAKAMLMFRIAIQINPKDAVAAGELGVLYARYNHFEEAKSLLVQSLRIRRDVTTWTNLSRVHQALGEQRLAQQARGEAEIAANDRNRNGFVHWTRPDRFGNVHGMVDPPLMLTRQQELDRQRQARSVQMHQGTMR